jgi:hypothetical protein
MSRFLTLAVFFVIAIGAVLHFGIEIPYLTGWIGQLPGDLVIQKGKMTMYVPIASSALASLALSFLSTLLFRK